jgi:hypothetical protein
MPVSEKIRHAGMVGDTLVCNRCGARQQLTLPQPVDSVVGLMKGWGKTHAKCRGNTSALRQANSLADWPLSDDTGVSSKAIYTHMTGRRPQTATFGNHQDRHRMDGLHVESDPRLLARQRGLPQLLRDGRRRSVLRTGPGIRRSRAPAVERRTAVDRRGRRRRSAHARSAQVEGAAADLREQHVGPVPRERVRSPRSPKVFAVMAWRVSTHIRC